MVSEDSGILGKIPLLSDHQASRLVSFLIEDNVDALDQMEAQGLPQIKDYLIDLKLGSGGGGTVYRGVRQGSDRNVAIKILHNRFSGERKAERAWRELDMLDKVRLPGFPHVYDYGVDDGRMYIVSEHVDGQRLDEYCRSKDLDSEQRVELLIRIARKIQGLHEHGIIHRDLKPENILVSIAGEPVIIDLGIASLIADDVMDTLTIDGTPIGSPAFMAPEQARGELEMISTRSDVYGLAATACLLLTGKTPHDVEVPLHEAIRRVAQDPPRLPSQLDPNLPRPLARILERGLSPHPADRYSSMEEFAADLERWEKGEPIAWQRPGWFSRQATQFQRNPRGWLSKAGIWMLVAMTIGFGAAAIGFMTVAGEKDFLLKEHERLREVEVTLASDQAEQLHQQEQFAQEMAQHRDDMMRDTSELVAIFESINDEADVWLEEGGQYWDMVATLRILDSVNSGRELPPMTEVLLTILNAVYQTDISGLQADVEALRPELDRFEQAWAASVEPDKNLEMQRLLEFFGPVDENK